jgi:hypothetical protein
MVGRTAFVFVVGLALAACNSGRSSRPVPPPPVNHAPVVVNDTAVTRPGVAVEVNVLANDTDADADAMAVEFAAAPASASLLVLPDQRVRVTPAVGFAGPVELRYRARDSKGAYSDGFANLSVNVGPQGRVMLGVTNTANAQRVIISGFAPGETQELVTFGACALGTFAVVSSDTRTIIGRRCAGGQRVDVVSMAPRAATLSPPVTLLTNYSLAPGFAFEPDGSRVTVASRIGNPDDLSLPGTYELVRVDVAARTVLSRLALPGIDNVSEVRGVFRSNRVLVSTSVGTPPFIVGEVLYLADLDTNTVVRINDDPVLPQPFGGVQLSADGRYLLAGIDLDVRGYDLTNPGQPVTLWNSALHATPTQTPVQAQFIVATSEMLVQLHDIWSGEFSLWRVTVPDTGVAQEIVRYENTRSDVPFLMRIDQALFTSDAATAGRSELRRVRLSTGQIETLTPAGGIALSHITPFGNGGVLINYSDATLPNRIGLIRADAPGVLETVAPGVAADFFLTPVGDRDGTTIGITAISANVWTAYLVDVNLLTSATPITAGLQPGENANVALITLPADR